MHICKLGFIFYKDFRWCIARTRGSPKKIYLATIFNNWSIGLISSKNSHLLYFFWLLYFPFMVGFCYTSNLWSENSSSSYTRNLLKRKRVFQEYIPSSLSNFSVVLAEWSSSVAVRGTWYLRKKIYWHILWIYNRVGK